jgi:hypothetical protein
VRIESARALNFFFSVVDRQSFDTAPEDPTSNLDADPDPATDPNIKLGKVKMKHFK